MELVLNQCSPLKLQYSIFFFFFIYMGSNNMKSENGHLNLQVIIQPVLIGPTTT